MHEEVRETIALLMERENTEGYDPFGFRPQILRQVLPVAHFFYRTWFRVDAHGIANVPEGRVLLIANHSGQLPFDGMMIGASLVLERRPPRVVRGMVEKWIPTLPFVSMFFARAGQVVGTPSNARALLERDEMLMVFPEGARGISKTFDRRYQLEEFGLGFMRLALETRTPIVPIGVVGAEEQLPALYNAEGLARVLGMPSLPISPTLVLPLPVKYRIYFGEPILFEGDPDDEDRAIRERVDVVTTAIRALLERGLSERTGIFT